jgi:hypothetical protein
MSPHFKLHNWANHPGVFGMRVYAMTILRFFEIEFEPEVSKC